MGCGLCPPRGNSANFKPDGGIDDAYWGKLLRIAQLFQMASADFPLCFTALLRRCVSRLRISVHKLSGGAPTLPSLMNTSVNARY
jgi:hypothetical protein